MKIFICCLSISFLLLQGCKDPCKNVNNYAKLDQQDIAKFYKPGSFWVYRDSIDGIIDSQYVYAYQFTQHAKDPADTVFEITYYQPNGGSAYCGPYFFDGISMMVRSIQNGLPKDTISYTGGTDYENRFTEFVFGHSFVVSSLGNPSIGVLAHTGWTELGLLKYTLWLTPHGAQNDTTATWYGGIFPVITSGNFTFHNISIWTVQIGDGSCPRFAHPTDLYIVEGGGIIKWVQHLPTRDVSWELINYQIIN